MAGLAAKLKQAKAQRINDRRMTNLRRVEPDDNDRKCPFRQPPTRDGGVRHRSSAQASVRLSLLNQSFLTPS